MTFPFKFGPMLQHRLILFATGLCLAGCSQSRPEGVLTYWCATNSFEIEFARRIVAEWNQDTTHLPVRFQPVPAGQSSEEVILAAIVGRTTPDIYSNIWPGVIEQYREAGAVVRLDQFADFDSVLYARLPDELIEQFRSPDSGFYQFPWKANPLLLYYNKGLLEEAGITELPRTYDQFFALAPRLVKDFDGDGHYDRWLLDPNVMAEWWQRFFDFYTFYIAATGGESLLDGHEVQLDRPETAAVLSFFRRGYQEGYFPLSIFQEDIFLAQKVVFHISGPWSISHLEKYKTEDFRYGITLLPVPQAGDQPVHTYGDPKNIVIFSTTRYPQEAWEFVKFMTSRAADRSLLEITSQLPMRRDLITDSLYADYFTANPLLEIFARQIPFIVGTDHTIYLQEIFDIISQEYEAACLYQVQPIAQAVASMTKRVTALIDRESRGKAGVQ
ncbi:MAG: extracellular solute-binding protein [Candidatus Marinimicrobia bacterium]|nr:extracellular solute-binding protein [Candidatus Neomarinimicrobiota bacterium]